MKNGSQDQLFIKQGKNIYSQVFLIFENGKNTMDVTKNLDIVRSVTLNNIPQTEIAQSKLHGFGLFATEKINNDQVLCMLDGQVVSKEAYENIEKTIDVTSLGYENYFYMECNYIDGNNILARLMRTKYSYINHGREANVEVQYEPMRIVCIKDILPGDELVIDYRKEPLGEAYLAREDKGFL